MTNLDVSNSSTDSSSGTSSDSSSSGSSSTTSTASSSSDSDTSSDSPPVAAAAAPKSPTKNNIDDKKKEEKQRRLSIKQKVSSSSDDDNQKTENNKIPPPRRRSSAKLRNSLPNSSKANCKPIPKTLAGNKTPRPSTKLSQRSSIKSSDSRNSTPSLKKKSIFSPDNSSESDTEDSRSKSSSNNNNNNKSSPNLRSKSRQRRSSIESVKPSPSEKNDERNHRETNHVKRRSSGSRSNGPPSKKVVEDKSATSSSSSQSSSELDTHDSDSEPSKNLDSSSRSLRSKQSSVNKSTTSSTSNSNSINDKDLEVASRLAGETSVGAVPRKLTRSLSARVSRMAAMVRATVTDTDSETDDKNSIDLKKCGRNVLRSPVLPPTPPEACEPQERCCPVRGCDSSGHLGGEQSRHFTWDACPMYHNVSTSWCASAGEERGAAGHARRRAVAALSARAQRALPSLEQRAYRLKVKDMRSKWKSESKERQSEDNSEDLSTEREPTLDGFTPDYDLRLFREAQALAAIKIEDELEDLPSDRGTRYVVMGKYRMEVWYQSPYPGAAARAPRLFVCEYCLQHQPSRTGHHRHTNKCTWKHPPGDEVYRKDKLSVWQVDGRRHKQYCQQLCLLAKFFLDHKTLYYDVEPFLFYVMTIADNEGCHIVGYFSKEKNSFLNYNVSCILTLPPYQRQGYGRLLIDFSYLLTKVEGKVGSPETPLSDLGLISYRSYWKDVLLRRLCSAPGPTLSIRDLSKDLAIASCDIVSTLQERGLMKYWKGKHIVLKKQEVLEEMSRRGGRARCVSPSCLRWSPPAPPPPR